MKRRKGRGFLLKPTGSLRLPREEEDIIVLLPAPLPLLYSKGWHLGGGRVFQRRPPAVKCTPHPTAVRALLMVVLVQVWVMSQALAHDNMGPVTSA